MKLTFLDYLKIFGKTFINRYLIIKSIIFTLMVISIVLLIALDDDDTTYDKYYVTINREYKYDDDGDIEYYFNLYNIDGERKSKKVSEEEYNCFEENSKFIITELSFLGTFYAFIIIICVSGIVVDFIVAE